MEEGIFLEQMLMEFEPGKMKIICARSGVGKSLILQEEKKQLRNNAQSFSVQTKQKTRKA